jgi:hypothetical protein
MSVKETRFNRFLNNEAMVLAGLAALTEMLDMIGRETTDDNDVARVMCENELELRALIGALIAALKEVVLTKGSGA